MNTKPIYRNGELASITPPCVLIIFAAEACGRIETGCTDDEKQNSQTAVFEILQAARAGGYKQCEILETLLFRTEVSPRLGAMAHDACAAAGMPALRQIFKRAGLPVQ